MFRFVQSCLVLRLLRVFYQSCFTLWYIDLFRVLKFFIWHCLSASIRNESTLYYCQCYEIIISVLSYHRVSLFIPCIPKNIYRVPEKYLYFFDDFHGLRADKGSRKMCKEELVCQLDRRRRTKVKMWNIYAHMNSQIDAYRWPKSLKIAAGDKGSKF